VVEVGIGNFYYLSDDPSMTERIDHLQQERPRNKEGDMRPPINTTSSRVSPSIAPGLDFYFVYIS